MIRYSLDPEYVNNREKIKDCDIVFIAVPTPTTPKGFDDSIVRDCLKLVGANKIAVIKSTVIPGTTEDLQRQYPEILVLHSPEFLTESSAAHDAAHPQRNIIGIPSQSDVYLEKAKLVMGVLPPAPYNKICSSVDAEIIKYGRNISGYLRVIFANLLYDLTNKLDGNWEDVKEAMSADPDTGPTYLNPIHKSGRGAGGHCFIKDFASFAKLYHQLLPDDRLGYNILVANELKNNDLLRSTKKDIDLLEGVYGQEGSIKK